MVGCQANEDSVPLSLPYVDSSVVPVGYGRSPHAEAFDLVDVALLQSSHTMHMTDWSVGLGEAQDTLDDQLPENSAAELVAVAELAVD